MKQNNDTVVAFILSHGRPDNVFTYDALRKHGYTGPIYLLVDDLDETLPQYVAKYGNEVIVFSKELIARTTDMGDNFKGNRSDIYARNASFDIAASLGIKYFIQLDDDYPAFVYKHDSELNYIEHDILDLDRTFASLLTYYKSIPALSIAIAQNGDFIGGKNNGMATDIKPRRKAMNTFICSTERRFKFIGRMNDDVNTYVVLGRQGQLFLTIPNIAIHQKPTQKTKGGMTELYLDSGTYVKSFYSVMYAPSCVKVSVMGTKNKRIHHRVNWNNTVPVILSEAHKKQP